MVMLGPVANAGIEILGTGGVLATGTTAEDGSFGPLDYDGDYTGPLRIRATGNAASTWTCDYYRGCRDDQTMIAFGESLAFDGVIEAVAPFAEDGQFVSVSLLSTFVAKRVDVLGTLSSAAVETAAADMAATLRQAMPETLAALSLEVPNDFTRLALFDLAALPEPGGDNDDLSLVLTSLNAAIMGLHVYSELTVGEFIELFAAEIAAEPVLPVGAREFWEPSVENIALNAYLQVDAARGQAEEVAARFEALLAPATLYDWWNAAAQDWQVPSLLAWHEEPAIEDPESLPPGTLHYRVIRIDAQPLSVSDFNAWVFDITGTGPVLLTTEPVSIDGVVYLRVLVDAEAVSQAPVGTYEQVVNLYSTTGEVGRFQVVVEVIVE